MSKSLLVWASASVATACSTRVSVCTGNFMSVSDQLRLLSSWLTDAAKWYDSETGEFIRAFQSQCGTLSLASLHLLEMATRSLISGQLDTAPTSKNRRKSALIALEASLAVQPLATSSTTLNRRSAKRARTGKKSKALLVSELLPRMPPVFNATRNRQPQPSSDSYNRNKQPNVASHVAAASCRAAQRGGAITGLPAQKSPYGWVGSSLAFLSSTSNGDTHQLISEHPIYLAGVYEGETRGDFTLAFRQHLPAKSWFTISLPAKLLMGRNGHGRARGAWRQHH